VIILDTLLIGGIRFVLGKLVDAVEAEMDDDSALKDELLAAQMRLELGEITEAEFTRTERALLERISEIRSQRRGEEGSGGLRVTGAEVTFEGDEEPIEESRAARPRGRRRR